MAIEGSLRVVDPWVVDADLPADLVEGLHEGDGLVDGLDRAFGAALAEVPLGGEGPVLRAAARYRGAVVLQDGADPWRVLASAV